MDTDGQKQGVSNTSQRKSTSTKGAALLLMVLFVTVISIVIVLGFTRSLVREFRNVKSLLVSSDIYYTAEAGNEDAYYRLKNGLSYTSPQKLVIDEAIATTTIVGAGSDWDISTLSGKQSLTRKVEMSVSSTITEAGFPYGAQIGEGGITMENNSKIQGAGGLDGDVYSNGSERGPGGATITGDITISTGIDEDMTERSTICDTDEIVGKVSPNTDYAQSFVASDSKDLSKISIYLKKDSVPGDRTIYIVADNAGEPDTVSLADGVLDSGLVGVVYAWIDVVFSTPPTLTKGNTYWIVFDANSHTNKYWTWCKDGAGGYATGTAKYSDEWNTDPWNSVVGDMTFKIFLGEGYSEIDLVDVSGTAKANTIKNSTVGGDAYYQTIVNTTVSGTKYPGSADPPIVPMPLSDANIAAWRTSAEAGSVVSGDCPGSPGCSLSMGPVKIDGDLSVGISDIFTLTGLVYVTGDFTPGNLSQIKCDMAFGDQSCILLIDGNIDVSNNATFSGSGDPNSFLLALSTIEGCLGGAQQPECAPQNSAIYVANNAAGVVFYATDSQIHLNNGVGVTSVVGYQLHLAPNAIITYDTNISDLDLSSGPDGGWEVNDWGEVE